FRTQDCDAAWLQFLARAPEARYHVDAGDRLTVVRGRPCGLHARHQDARADDRLARRPRGPGEVPGKGDEIGCLRPAFLCALFLLAQIVLGRAQSWAGRGAVGVDRRFGRGDHAAVLAHLDQVEPAVLAALEHPVAAGELGGDSLDRALRPERLAAADAAE